MIFRGEKTSKKRYKHGSSKWWDPNGGLIRLNSNTFSWDGHRIWISHAVRCSIGSTIVTITIESYYEELSTRNTFDTLMGFYKRGTAKRENKTVPTESEVRLSAYYVCDLMIKNAKERFLFSGQPRLFLMIMTLRI